VQISEVRGLLKLEDEKREILFFFLPLAPPLWGSKDDPVDVTRAALPIPIKVVVVVVVVWAADATKDLASCYNTAYR
jgi:hypothetical protein